jgi:splicing factor 3A subunit 3
LENRYIKGLHAYVLSFVKRTQPLTDVDSQQREVENEFNAKWEAGEFSGWEEANKETDGNKDGTASIWCSACAYITLAFETCEQTKGAPSGQKHYSKQTVYDAHLSSKKHLKATAKQAAAEPPPPNPNGIEEGSTPIAAPQTSTKSRVRNSALLTHLTTNLLAGLVTVLNETKSNVERRFSLTAREREQELLEQQQSKPAAASSAKGADGAGAEDEEEEERIYNPLKLPLGWDGKPIPYWLYKLHGLGVEYRCEICSDHVYMGRCVSNRVSPALALTVGQEKF